MPKYFCSDQVLTCFQRLVSSKSEGKTALERTSGLMFFLAIDAVSKNKGESCLDLNPNNSDGTNTRKMIELEFTKLVLVGKFDGHLYQVCELGKIAKDGMTPEKRISSNFFTVPLKKASEQAAPYYYPKRPVPLMNLGQAATGVKWGIAPHPDWQKNILAFLSEITGSTFFTDLAVFVMRDSLIPEAYAKKCVDALTILIENKYSTALADFWIDRIKKEQVLIRHLASPFCDSYEPLADKLRISEDLPGKTEPDDWKYRIAYLEKLLRENGIEY